ncbi:MAG: D-glycero-beta-D-manno-heptose 1-phosphate adenylyltransferase [Ferruginibacter sp.]
MKSIQAIPTKIYTLTNLLVEIKRWRLKNKKIVFTNGVFDILHKGHIASLSEAATFGDVLITAINSDASVKRLKGPDRPVNDEDARALVIASLVVTDAVVIFDEDTPLALIQQILPDVLVKGMDYSIQDVVGAQEVMANGGEVKLAKMIAGISTSSMIEIMKNAD